MPVSPHDDLNREVRAYRARFLRCTPEQILQAMEEMRAFFFDRMTPADWARYRKVKALMEARAAGEPAIPAGRG